jgi:transcriptional regulator with XRE-family HTH domain
MRLNIEKVMKSKGINAIALSEKMESLGTPLNRIGIGRIINENVSPKLETLQNIAIALDVSLFDLFENENFNAIYSKNNKGEFIEIGYLLKNTSND